MLGSKRAATCGWNLAWAALGVAGLGASAMGQCTPHWSALGTGMTMEAGDSAPATVATMAVYDDGSGPALYAGGVFTVAGGVSAYKVAKWNGTAWSPLGDGMEYNSLVLRLAVHNGALYAAGTFNTAGGIPAARVARWDGTSWSALGVGLNGQSNALASFDDGTGPALFVGGTFTTAGGVTVNRIAKWDGANWSALGTGMSSFVNVIVPYNGALYVGGNFTTAGGVSAARIAKWNGTAWSAVGTGATGAVNDFVAFDSGSGTNLYAGGSFGINKWDGASWTAVAGAPGASAMAVFDGSLVTTGGFATINGSECANNIAKWNGAAWTPLDQGLYSNGNSMVAWNGGLYVSGQFLSASGVPNTVRVARWGCP